MYVYMSTSSAPIADVSVEAVERFPNVHEEDNLPILEKLIDEAANKLRRMYGFTEK